MKYATQLENAENIFDFLISSSARSDYKVEYEKQNSIILNTFFAKQATSIVPVFATIETDCDKIVFTFSDPRGLIELRALWGFETMSQDELKEIIEISYRNVVSDGGTIDGWEEFLISNLSHFEDFAGSEETTREVVNNQMNYYLIDLCEKIRARVDAEIEQK